MQSTTFIETATKDGNPISVRLGDVFIMKSRFVAIKSDVDISNYIILSLLAVAIIPAGPNRPPSRIYFSMIGMDNLRYSVSKRTENGLIILDHGKETELDEKYIIRATKALAGNRGSGIIGGLEVYMRTIVTSPSKIKAMNMRKLPTRLVDLSKWPRMSLRQWAIYHLGLQHVPPVNHIENRTNMINSMIKQSVSARRSDSPNGEMRGMSVHGVITGRIRSQDYRTDGARFGKIHGVPFISLSLDELKLPRKLGDCIEAHPLSDVYRNHVSPYMIVCINNKPEWVLLDGDIRPQGHLTWTFHDGYKINMPMKAFDSNMLKWLTKAYDEDAEVEEVEEVVEEMSDEYGMNNSLHVYGSGHNYAVNSINNDMHYAIGAEPVAMPALRKIDGECIWGQVEEPTVYEKHKHFYNRINQVYEPVKNEAVEDPEEEVLGDDEVTLEDHKIKHTHVKIEKYGEIVDTEEEV